MPSRKSSRQGAGPRVSQGRAIGPLRILMLEDNEADAELNTHELQRSGLAVMTWRVDTAEAFAAALRSFAPDVVLADHSVAHFDSSAALRILRSLRPATPLIVVTETLTGAQSVAVTRQGAADIVLRPYLSRLPSAILAALEVRRGLSQLTSRQLEVLKLVAEGDRTRDIATRLGLSIKTVESHRGEIMKRLGVHDVVSLVRYAVRVGLVTADD
jgi:DNA-binding NarL/FixJ family response regulator